MNYRSSSSNASETGKDLVKNDNNSQGFSFASGSKTTASEPSTEEEKKPMFGGIKQESETVPKVRLGLLGTGFI